MSLRKLTVCAWKFGISTGEDDYQEISLKKSRYIDKKLNVGDTIWLPFEGAIGRIEILKAKQVIASRIRRIEAEAVHKEFKDKEN